MKETLGPILDMDGEKPMLRSRVFAVECSAAHYFSILAMFVNVSFVLIFVDRSLVRCAI